MHIAMEMEMNTRTKMNTHVNGMMHMEMVATLQMSGEDDDC